MPEVASRLLRVGHAADEAGSSVGDAFWMW